MANYYRLAKVGVFGVLLSGASAGLLAVPVRLSAQDAPKAPQTAPPKAKKPAGKPIIKDEFGNPLAELKPKKDETPEQKKHAEALALFMSGKLKADQSRFTDALADYQAAIKIDPKAVDVYRELVPLAFALNETEKGLDYAQKAIELDPQNLEILKILATQLREAQKLEKAADYLERAIKSTQLKHDSATYVILHLQLATLEMEMRKIDKAADAYTVVFDARRNPGKYNLDFQTRSMLEREGLRGSRRWAKSSWWPAARSRPSRRSRKPFSRETASPARSASIWPRPTSKPRSTTRPSRICRPISTRNCRARVGIPTSCCTPS